MKRMSWTDILECTGSWKSITSSSYLRPAMNHFEKGESYVALQCVALQNDITAVAEFLV